MDSLSSALAELSLLVSQDSLASISQIQLRTAIAACTDVHTLQITDEHRKDMMKTAATLWNTSITRTESIPLEIAAILKQGALQIQWTVYQNPAKIDIGHQLRLVEHSIKTAETWCDVEQWEIAHGVLDQAMVLEPPLMSYLVSADSSNNINRTAATLFALLLQRLKTCMHVSSFFDHSSLFDVLKKIKALVVTGSTAVAVHERTTHLLDVLSTLLAQAEKLVTQKLGSSDAAVLMLEIAHETYAVLRSFASEEMMRAKIMDDTDRLGNYALALLCWAHIRCGTQQGAENALKCLQTLPQDVGNDTDVLSVVALAQAGRGDEAEQKLRDIVTNPDIDLHTTAYVLHEFLVRSTNENVVKQALSVAYSNRLMTGEDFLALSSLLLELFLCSELDEFHENNDGHDVDICSTPTSRLALFLVRHEGVIAAASTANHLPPHEQHRHKSVSLDSIQEKIHIMCWNHACLLFQKASSMGGNSNRFFDMASQFYAASINFLAAPLEGEETRNSEDTIFLSQAYMAIALCHESQGNHVAALDALAQMSPQTIEIEFLKFKIYLSVGDEPEAIRILVESEIFKCSADGLRAACCEAMASGAVMVAVAALKQLVDVCGRGDPCDGESTLVLPIGYESVIYCNLIRLLSTQSRDSAQVAIYFRRLIDRVHTVGKRDFFLPDPEQRYQQILWLKNTAWNEAIHSEKQKTAPGTFASSSLFACCADLSELLKGEESEEGSSGGMIKNGDESDGELSCKYKAHVMAAVNALEDGNISLLEQFMSAALSAERSLKKTRVHQNNENTIFLNDIEKYQVLCRIVQCNLAVLQDDVDAAIACIESTKCLPHAPAISFLLMAKIIDCRQPVDKRIIGGSRSMLVARKLATKAALELLTSQPTVNRAAFTALFVDLIQQSSASSLLSSTDPSKTPDQERILMFRDALALLSMVSSESDALSTHEDVAYLVTSAWNQGISHAKYDRLNEALSLMSIAIKIMDRVLGENSTWPDQKARESMRKEYERVTAVLHGVEGKNKDENNNVTDSVGIISSEEVLFVN